LVDFATVIVDWVLNVDSCL
jgi:chromosome segregation ATPase